MRTIPMEVSSSKDRSTKLPRIVCYHQTHYHHGTFVSILPLIKTEATHVVIAAIHINSRESITLNDDPYQSPKNVPLWSEVHTLQQEGFKVLGMLGGAAQGTFIKLDGNIESFEAYYSLLYQMVSWTGLDGLDIDVEEAMSIAGIIRLIHRLKLDFGQDFLITLPPIATAMVNQQNLSGFDYEVLEKAFAANVAWYNVQFYNGWGSMKTTKDYERIIARGWPASKVVVGLVTNPENGTGWVPDKLLRGTLTALRMKYPDFGGVMGWEYFNSMTEEDGHGNPWCWAQFMGKTLRDSRE